MPPPPPPGPEPQWPIPTFNLRIEDLAHPGAKLFLDNVRADEALRNAVTTVCTWLYTEQTVPRKYVGHLSFEVEMRLTSAHSASGALNLVLLPLRCGHATVPMMPSGGCPRRRHCNSLVFN